MNLLKNESSFNTVKVLQSVVYSKILYTFASLLKNKGNSNDSLAQQVEHNTFNVGVLGSSPRRITKKGG